MTKYDESLTLLFYPILFYNINMYDLTKILPHKPPMILLDDIVEVDIENAKLSSVFRVYPKKVFFEEDKGINSLTGIEFMAQTIGAYAYFKNKESEPKPGLLLGTRLYNNKIPYFKEGEEYKVTVHEIFTDNKIAVFDCLIYDKFGEEIASATVNTYQGDNIEELVESE